MITIELKGRLGNQMFQYATCRSIAERNSTEFGIINPNKWLGNGLFNCDVKKATPEKYAYKETKDRVFEKNKEVLNKNNVHLDGFFQSEKYFLDYEKKIKDWFQTKDLNVDDNKCIIHLRGGDYKSHGYLLSREYFEKAKSLIKGINENILFEIVTDDKSLAKKYFPNDTVSMEDQNNDFLKIKNAKYLIISNSSFSWWGGWLNNNAEKIIAPKYWFNRENNKNWYPYDIKSKKFTYV